MPYIAEELREDLVGEGAVSPETPGQLNYLFTLEIADYIETRGLSYQTINDIVGALEGAKLEFYRRVAVPYEEQKRFENGDVYVDNQ